MNDGYSYRSLFFGRYETSLSGSMRVASQRITTYHVSTTSTLDITSVTIFTVYFIFEWLLVLIHTELHNSFTKKKKKKKSVLKKYRQNRHKAISSCNLLINIRKNGVIQFHIPLV